MLSITLINGNVQIIGSDSYPPLVKGDDYAVVREYARQGQVGYLVSLTAEPDAFFPKSAVTGHLHFQGRGGDDTFENLTDLPSIVEGGPGNDSLVGGDGPDTMYGGSGRDQLEGRGGADLLRGEKSDHRLYVSTPGCSSVPVVVRDDDGSDRLYGGDGPDTLYGGQGTDELYGGYGNDELHGDDDNDRLQGDDGVDQLYGGTGHDYLDGGYDDGERDYLHGGAGYDVFISPFNEQIVPRGQRYETITVFDEHIQGLTSPQFHHALKGHYDMAENVFYVYTGRSVPEYVRAQPPSWIHLRVRLLQVALDDGTCRTEITRDVAQAWVDETNAIYWRSGVQLDFDFDRDVVDFNNSTVRLYSADDKHPDYSKAVNIMTNKAAEFPRQLVLFVRPGFGFSSASLRFGVVSNYQENGCTKGLIQSHLAHEVGHYLGLTHTMSVLLDTLPVVLKPVEFFENTAQAVYQAANYDANVFDADRNPPWEQDPPFWYEVHAIQDTPPSPFLGYPLINCDVSYDAVGLVDAEGKPDPLDLTIARTNVMSYWYAENDDYALSKQQSDGILKLATKRLQMTHPEFYKSAFYDKQTRQVVIGGGYGDSDDEVTVVEGEGGLWITVTIGKPLPFTPTGPYTFAIPSSEVDSIRIVTHGGNDRIKLFRLGVRSSGSVQILGGDGTDIIQIGDGNLDSHIRTPVEVDGGGGQDLLLLDDIADVGHDSYELWIEKRLLDPEWTGRLAKRDATGLPTTFAGVKFWSSTENMRLDANAYDNTVNVSGLPQGTALAVHGNGGNDDFRIGQGQTLDRANQGTISLFGDGGYNSLSLDDQMDVGPDTYRITASSFEKTNFPALTYASINQMELLANEENNTIRVDSLAPITSLVLEANAGSDAIVVGAGDVDKNLLGTLTVVGGPGADALTIDDKDDDPGADSYAIDAISFRKTFMKKLFYSETETLTLDGSANNDTVFLYKTSPGMNVRLNTNAGKDVVHVNPLTAHFDQPAIVRVEGGYDFDQLVIHDSSATADGVYDIGSHYESGWIEKGNSAVVFRDVDELVLSAGSGNDLVKIKRNVVPTTVHGSGGKDEFHVNAPPGAPLTLHGGPPTTAPGDSLTVQGVPYVSVGSFEPSPTTPGEGTVTVDGQTITFTGLEPIEVSGFQTFRFVTPNSRDDVTDQELEPGKNLISGSSSGVLFEDLIYSDVGELIIDMMTNDDGGGDDALKVIHGPVMSAGLTTIRAGSGQNSVEFAGGESNVALSGDNLTVTASNPTTLVNLMETTVLSAVHLFAGATLALAPGGDKALKTSLLDIEGTVLPEATLDLADNSLLIDYDDATPSPLARHYVQVLHAREQNPEAFWTGTGITSSIAAATPDTHGLHVNEFVALSAAAAGRLPVRPEGDAIVISAGPAVPLRWAYLEDGGVVVWGTDADDYIRVNRDDEQHYVTFGDIDRVVGFFKTDVTRPQVTVYTLGGNDEFNASPAELRVYAFAGEGNDHIVGSRFDDLIRGGPGNDNLAGADGNDVIYGDAGIDHLVGSNGNDALYGGQDRDFLLGLAGDDMLYGGEGHDELFGGRGNDELFGGEGDDLLSGGEGVDLLYGESGNDTLDGGFDLVEDLLSGGAGADVFVQHIQNATEEDWIADFNLLEDIVTKIVH